MTLFLDRVPGEDGVPIWKVGPGTSARIPALYAEIGYGPVGDRLPPMFVEVRFLEIALWQWVALLCLVPASVLVASLLVMPAMWLFRALSTRGQPAGVLQTLEAARAPIRLLIAVALFHVTRRLLGLAVAVHHAFVTVEEVIVVVGVTWLLLRLVDVGGGKLVEGQSHEAKIAVAVWPSGR